MKALVVLLGAMVLLLVMPRAASAQQAAPVPQVQTAPQLQPSVVLTGPPGEPSASASTTSPTPAQQQASTNPLQSFATWTQEQVNTFFSGLVTFSFQKATDGIKDAVAKLFSDANLVTNTAPTWTYQQATVVKLRDAMVLVANAAVGLLIFWMGLNITLRPYFGEGYPDLREALPRLLLGVVLANSSQLWVPWAIDLNNQLCGWIGQQEAGTLGDWLQRTPSFTGGWDTALLLVLFLLVCVWLYLKLAARLALLLVLIVTAPVALICWALPQTRPVASGWIGRFFPTLYAQVIVTIALKLAIGFILTTSGPIALAIGIFLLLAAASSPDLLRAGGSGVGMAAIGEAIMVTRMLGGGPAAGAGVAAAAGSVATSGARGVAPVAAARSTSAGWAGSVTQKATRSHTGWAGAVTQKGTGFVPGGFGPGGRRPRRS